MLRIKKIFVLALMCAVCLCLSNNAYAEEFVAVDDGHYQRITDIVYPVIITDNATVMGKMNKEIRAEVASFVEGMKKDFNNDVGIAELGVKYEIACNNPGLLSIILTEYIFPRGASHPLTVQRTLNFNSETGVRLTVDSLSEIAKYDENGESGYSPAALTRKLRAHAKRKNIGLYEDYSNLKKIPQDFYFDQNLHVHFIFQQYEVAPYAAGIIDVDADA